MELDHIKPTWQDENLLNTTKLFLSIAFRPSYTDLEGRSEKPPKKSLPNEWIGVDVTIDGAVKPAIRAFKSKSGLYLTYEDKDIIKQAMDFVDKATKK